MDTHALPLTSEQLIQASRSNTAIYDGEYHFYDLQCGIQMHGGTLCARNDVTCRRMVNPYVAFVLLLKGTLKFGIGTEYHEIKADGNGRAVLISLNQNALFTRFLTRGEQLTKVTLNGLEQWLPDNASELSSQHVRHWPISDQLHRLAKHWLQQPFQNDLSGNSHALHILNACWQTYGKKLDTCKRPDKTNHSCDLTLINTLEKAYADGATSINALAEALHVSRRTLQRRVHDTLGISLQQWLLATRMQQAMSLLTDDQLTIGEVAYQIGYRHTSNFIHAFRQHFGITPATILHQCN